MANKWSPSHHLLVSMRCILYHWCLCLWHLSPSPVSPSPLLSSYYSSPIPSRGLVWRWLGLSKYAPCYLRERHGSSCPCLYSVGDFAGSNLSPISNPGTKPIPVQRLQFGQESLIQQELGQKAYGRRDTWLDFLIPGWVTACQSGPVVEEYGVWNLLLDDLTSSVCIFTKFSGPLGSCLELVCFSCSKM